ncbi:MAG TPA: hypothetical protein VJH95_01920 [Candidatus Nanoarchaeia archaeon]|nr:hypothetical protein [Candidatus Nanoarchaeia archaeon]
MKIKENKSIFLGYFGDTPELRVLDFLIDNHFFDFPITTIAKESNVSYNSLVSFMPSWVEKKIVLKTRRIGKSDYYQLNMNNSFVRNIIKLDWSLTKKTTLPELKEEELLI